MVCGSTKHSDIFEISDRLLPFADAEEFQLLVILVNSLMLLSAKKCVITVILKAQVSVVVGCLVYRSLFEYSNIC